MTPRSAIAALVILAACTGEALPQGVPSTPGRPPSVQIIAVGVPLVAGPERAVRIGFQSASGFATVIVNHPIGARADVCPLRTVGAPLPERGCITSVGRGVRETIGSGSVGLGGVAIVYHDAPAAAEIRVEFEEAGRDVTFRLPRLERPPGASVCKDNGCNPFFEMMPVRGGPFSARASWRGGAALLQLQSGRVLARSFTATNIPYRIPAEREGGSPIGIETRLSAPAEYALAFVNESGAALTDIVIEASWP